MLRSESEQRVVVEEEEEVSGASAVFGDAPGQVESYFHPLVFVHGLEEI